MRLLAFSLTVGAWFGAWGTHQVLFAWLVVGELDRGAAFLGMAQTVMIVPMVVCLAVGGAAADRFERRMALSVLYLVAAALGAVLGGIVAGGALTIGVVLAYALAMGALSGLSLPPRDAMLSDVAGGDILRAVTIATTAQFVFQFGGSVVGSRLADLFGTPFALGFQSAIFALGVAAIRRLPSSRARRSPAAHGTDGEPRVTSASRTRELAAGLLEVWASPSMRPVMLLSIGVGLFFMGPYLVIFPVLIEQVYAGDVADLGLVQAMFPLGTVAASLYLAYRGSVARRGAALVAAQATAAGALFSSAWEIPFPALLVAVAIWGVCGGIAINVGRAVFQLGASEENRGRVLAVYTLGITGSGIVGAPLAGGVGALIGPQLACAAAGVAMWVYVLTIISVSPVLRMR